MEFFVMKYVVNVAEYGNFSQAAQACHVGQPALSQQIAKLERELGTPLFFRNPRGSVLTEAGKEFVRRARTILKECDDLSSQMASYAGLQRGSLTIGLITSLECIEFGDMLAAFVRNYPNISISIRQYGTYQLIDFLQERTIDLAFVNYPMQSISSSLIFEKLGEDRYALAVPSDHPLASKKLVHIKELKNERFIFHQPWQVASELVYCACKKSGFEPNIICRSGTPSTSFYMVQGGMGVALFPLEEFRKRNLKGVRCIEIAEPITKEVGILWRRDSTSPLVKTMAQFSKEWCQYTE